MRLLLTAGWSCCVWLVLLLACSTPVCALYEDQIGKLDWYQQHVGHVQHAHFHHSARNVTSLLLASSHSILASIRLSTSHSPAASHSNDFSPLLQWRHVAELGEVVAASHLFPSSLISVSAPSSIVRAHSPSSGALQWESGTWHHSRPTLSDELSVQKRGGDFADLLATVTATVLPVLSGSDAAWVAVQYGQSVRVLAAEDGSEVWRWAGNGGDRSNQHHVVGLTATEGGVHVVSVGDSAQRRVSVTSLSAVNGAVRAATHVDVAAADWMEAQHVHISSHGFVVVLHQSINTIDIVHVDSSGEYRTTSTVVASILPTDHRTAASLALSNDIRFPSAHFLLQSSSAQHMLAVVGGAVTHVVSIPPQFRVIPSSTAVSSSVVWYAAVHVNFPPNKPEIVCNVYRSDSDEPVFSAHHLWHNHGDVRRGWLQLASDQITKQPLHARLLLVSDDHTLSYVRQGVANTEWQWDRDEALSSITAVAWSELPVDSDIHVGAHSYPGLWERAGLQVRSVYRTVLSLIRTDWSAAFGGSKGLVAVREHTGPLVTDEFGLRKLAIAATATGRLYAFVSDSGALVWQNPIATRGARVWRLEMVSPTTLLVVTEDAGASVTVHELDALTGSTLSSRVVAAHIETVVITPYKTSSLQHIVLLTDADRVYVHPHTAEALSLLQPHLHTLFYHHVDLPLNAVTGYAVSSYDSLPDSLSHLRASQVWQLSFPFDVERIASLANSHPFRTVQSSVRVVGGGDGGLLYKYLNPNLLMLATERTDAAGRPLVPSVKKSTDPSVSVYLLDTVSGAVYDKWVHRGAIGPVHCAQNENLLVYHYYNANMQHYEVSVIELYEPRDADSLSLLYAVRSVGSHAAPLSSFTEPPPYAIQQSYLFRSAVKSLAVTHTLRGITSAELLAVLPTDQVLAIPKHLLDPRRPTGEPSNLDRAEGLIPYMGELPIQAAGVANYNRSVAHCRQLSTSPALLESTSLVCAWGVDVWCSRVSPSGTFDLLNEDFNAPFLLLTVTAVIAAIVATRQMAKRKELHQAWK